MVTFAWSKVTKTHRAAFFLDSLASQTKQQPRELAYAQTALGLLVVLLTFAFRKKPMPGITRILQSHPLNTGY